MTKYKKITKTLTLPELALEIKKLQDAIFQAKLDKMGGRNKNLRTIFCLRKKLAIAKTYMKGGSTTR